MQDAIYDRQQLVSEFLFHRFDMEFHDALLVGYTVLCAYKVALCVSRNGEQVVISQLHLLCL